MLTKEQVWLIIEDALTWIVVFAMLVYGGGKIVQFNGAANMDRLVSDLSGMELMWAFYGYSYTFVIILGILEITGGLLMFYRKTRLIGCLFISTILINVILQDIFYVVAIGALKAAIIYQGIILIILWKHKEKIYTAMRGILITGRSLVLRKQSMVRISITFLLFLLLRVLEYFITIKW